MTAYEFDVTTANCSGPTRLDRFICSQIQTLTRSQLKQRLETLRVNNDTSKISRMIRPGDAIHLQLREEQAVEFEAEPVPLDILYEDQDIIVLNKTQGMVVHPAAGNWTGTIANGLAYHTPELTTEFTKDNHRPGIVHRLDKETSGVLVTARNLAAYEKLSAQFQLKSVRKTYFALVKGCPVKQTGTIKTGIIRDPANRKRFTTHPSEGKQAVTHYWVQKKWKNYSLVKLKIETGRTHQIRVHMKHAGCPVLGDPLYARKDKNFTEASMLLHAFSITFTHPHKLEEMKFSVKLPDYFAAALLKLHGECRAAE